MASMKQMKQVTEELNEKLGTDKARKQDGLKPLTGLKGDALKKALLEEAAEIHSRDQISDTTVEILKSLGWAGTSPEQDARIEAGGEGGTPANESKPDVDKMDHDDLIEELQGAGVEVPKNLRKTTEKSTNKLRQMVTDLRGGPATEGDTPDAGESKAKPKAKAKGGADTKKKRASKASDGTPVAGSARETVAVLVQKGTLTADKIIAAAEKKGVPGKTAKMYLQAWRNGVRVPYNHKKTSTNDAGVVAFV